MLGSFLKINIYYFARIIHFYRIHPSSNAGSYIMTDGQYLFMAGKSGSFWLGVVVGFIVMTLLNFLLVAGPIIGGFIAGIIAKGGAWGGATAGFVSGLFGAIVISVILVLGGTLLLGFPGFITALGVSFVLVIATLYFAILGFVGGAIGGALVK